MTDLELELDLSASAGRTSWHRAAFIQIFLALCFLGVNGPEDIGWMLGLSGVMMLLHGAYVTAERAALPNIVSKENLATANALDAASWSSALCIGAMLGGVVVELYGVEAAFIIDALTFLLGTVLLIPLTLPQTIGEEMDGPLLSTAVSNIKKGLRNEQEHEKDDCHISSLLLTGAIAEVGGV